jgi:RNA polymerase sigma-70 factor (ECF subfamily)
MSDVRHASHDPDLLLIRAMALGDKGAMAELYTRHGRKILSYLLGQINDRHLAEEVLQDVMTAAWRGAGGFRGDSTVRTWLLAIARIKVLNVWRRREQDTAELDDEMMGDGFNVSARIEQSDEQEAVRRALYALPDDQRETLELIFYHDLTGPEAAEVLGVAEGTVKSRVFRAKRTLRGLLQQKEVDHEQ